MTWTITKDDDGTLNIRAILRPDLDPDEAKEFAEALKRKLNESDKIAVEGSTTVIT
jgi:hypothetical protein